ncbi:MAG: amino acid ABC transporter permease [Mesorhizobium sp.]
MGYQFRFDLVLAHWPAFVEGAMATLIISVVASVLGLLIGVAGALVRSYGPRPLSVLVGVYVEVIRNTPFLVQLFIVYFGLPAIGIKADANLSAVSAMAINVGAYATEIVRAGLASIPRGQIEAAAALGLRPYQIFIHVMLVPAARTIFSALTGQFTLVMLTSSVVSAVSATDLAGVANRVAAIGFRHLEAYSIATVIYLAMALAISGMFSLLSRRLFRYARQG